MKTINLNSDSLVYRFAEKMGDYDPDIHGADICAFVRRVFVGVIGSAALAALVLLVGGFAAWLVGDFVAWVFYVINHGWISPYIGAGITLVVIVLVSAYYVIKLALRGTKAAVQSSEVLSAGWDSVHHRICARLEIH
jgi:hypothetical protein